MGFDKERVILELEQEWNRLDITSDFIFCKVMQDEELLTELIESILPDVEIGKLVINSQKSIDVGSDIHGVRFDIYVKNEEGVVYDIEMQVLNRESLPKRTRYYSSANDMDMLGKGMSYNKLKDSYVIVICLFDYFEMGLHRYTFTNRCHEVDGLELGDGTTKIILNAVATADDVQGRLKAFLDYVAGRDADDDFVKRVDAAVDMARQNSGWRREYMMLNMRDLENQEIWYEQGHEEGVEQGIEQGIEQGVRGFISIYKQNGGGELDVVESVVNNMGLPEDKARMIVKKYW